MEQSFAGQAFDAEARRYLETHALRLARLCDCVAAIADAGPMARVLDVGPSFSTELLRQGWPEAQVDSLGFADSRFGPRPGEEHRELDLNSLLDPEPGSALPRAHYDLIVCAEVVEHLNIPPRPLLAFLREGLSPTGTLILQTPNAVSLGKRLRMLRGRQPYEFLRETPRNPGHVRELTRGELLRAAREAGLVVRRCDVRNDFLPHSIRGKLLRRLGALLPSSFRDDMTVVLEHAERP